MNHTKYTKQIMAILLWSLGAFIPFEVMAANDNDVKVAIDSFCKSEFQGVQERYDLAVFTNNYLKKKRKEGHEFDGKVNLWEWDSYYVVTSYNVLHVNSSGNTATADVVFSRIAYSKGKEEIGTDQIDKDVVTYNLVYKNNKWHVIDPPKARISINAIKMFYETSMSHLDDNWKKHASKGQWKYYYKTKAVLDFLNKL